MTAAQEENSMMQVGKKPKRTQPNRSRVERLRAMRLCALTAIAAALVSALSSCSGKSEPVEASGPTITVGVTKVVKKSLGRQLTLSSELVPFQEIDVYAKEAGYVKELNVDYGSHVRAGQVMAVLEIPELEAQIQEKCAENCGYEDRAVGVIKAARRPYP